jgi:hypothetical protein
MPCIVFHGPAENLWLDYSQVTGMLNQMQVLKPSEDANIGLQWELISDGDEEKPPSFSRGFQSGPFGPLCRLKRLLGQLLRRNNISYIDLPSTQGGGS